MQGSTGAISQGTQFYRHTSRVPMLTIGTMK
ncbi:MAG: hypothetical protein RJA63_1274 [Pseudomonadota bacterium]|jgi:hypothetical protein